MKIAAYAIYLWCEVLLHLPGTGGTVSIAPYIRIGRVDRL
jgi:hypothetical protein